MTTITSPTAGLTITTNIGSVRLEFKDGVAEVDDDALNAGTRTWLEKHGYGIDGDAPVQDEREVPEPPDPREVGYDKIGTPLRDGAVDPAPGDFLGPTNAGEANPHGPDVVNPEIHASETGPVVPGLVGDKDYQHAKESAVAEAVRSEQVPVPEVMDALEGVLKAEKVDEHDDESDEETEGSDDEQPDVAEELKENLENPPPSDEAKAEPAGNASKADWIAYAGLSEDTELTRDQIRAQYGSKA